MDGTGRAAEVPHELGERGVWRVAKLCGRLGCLLQGSSADATYIQGVIRIQLFPGIHTTGDCTRLYEAWLMYWGIAELALL